MPHPTSELEVVWAQLDTVGPGHGPATCEIALRLCWLNANLSDLLYISVGYVRAIVTSIANINVLFCKIEAGIKHERSRCRE